jgi:uncharacterized protein (DUF58 family)
MRSADAEPRQPWPDRLIRTRSSPQLRLSLRNLYILPSGFGWLWLAACGVLYLMGSLSASSGPLLLAYGGLGLFLLAPFLTQFNLQGLELRCGDPSPGFAAEPVLYPVEASSTAPRLQLRAHFRGQAGGWSGDLSAGRSNLAIPWTPPQRGLQPPGRLRLESRAPLGLFVCWTLWEPAVAQLIYPAPQRGSVGRKAASAQAQASATSPRERADGLDHWHDLAPHRPEEGVNRIAWKQLARSGVRLSKRFSDPEPEAELLTPDPALPWERALEQLCDRCLQLTAAGSPYGLLLEATHIEPAAGERQLRRCLEALALAPKR